MSVGKSISRRQSLFAGFRPSLSRPGTMLSPKISGSAPELTESPKAVTEFDLAGPSPPLRNTLSWQLPSAGNMSRENPSIPSAPCEHIAGDGAKVKEQSESKSSDPSSTYGPSVTSSDVGGPRFSTSVLVTTGERTAGEPSVYQDIKVVIFCFPFSASFLTSHLGPEFLGVSHDKRAGQYLGCRPASAT